MGYSRPRFYDINLSIGSSGSNPVDNTTYYLAAFDAGLSISTNTGYVRIYIPKTGVIRTVILSSYAVTAGTNENWTFKVEYPIGVTDTTIATVAANTNHRQWINNDLNIPVTGGDYIYIKTTTPTWVTNPEGFRITTTILIETA